MITWIMRLIVGWGLQTWLSSLWTKYKLKVQAWWSKLFNWNK